jgi:lipopolysaccharide biosynthesis glycosyltransferase
MLIDPNKWRELRIKQHVEALTLAHPSSMYTSDEMALNLIFRGHLTELRSCYNVFSFTEIYLSEIPRIWHFNTYKPIIHASLNQFYSWLSLFNTNDQILLKKLETISQNLGNAAMLAMKSQEYNRI